MKAYLKACDLWDIVEAATQPPKPEDDEIAFNAWSKKDAIALYLIRESSSAFYSSLFPAGTAQNAWDILAKFYNSEGSSLSFNLFLYRIVAISLLSLSLSLSLFSFFFWEEFLFYLLKMNMLKHSKIGIIRKTMTKLYTQCKSMKDKDTIHNIKNFNLLIKSFLFDFVNV